MADPSRGREQRLLLFGWGVLAVLLVGFAAPRVGLPGLYYDEAFMAQQAKDFFEPERGIHHPASTRQTQLFGRPFPLRNAVYLGALKSQMLIPSFALFGTRVPVLRLTTLAFSLVALLFVMLFAHQILGLAPALLGGALVAADPGILFLSLYEWGPYTTLLLCRSAGFFLIAWGWCAQRSLACAAGGVLLGLGVYSRADGAVVVVAGALAAMAVRPALVAQALGARRRLLVAVVLGGALGGSPMLLSLPDLLATSSHPVLGSRGDLMEKLRVLWSLADGSHFYRLMEVGGRFDVMFDLAAPAVLFPGLLLVATGLFVAGARGRQPTDPPGAALGFLLLTGALVTVGMLALPGAVRAHHLLNGQPYFHLFVAGVSVACWRRVAAARTRGLVRGALCLGLLAMLLSDARVIARTHALIEETGGRGRWSDAKSALARELESLPTGRGISLDWGLHEPLLFETHEARLLEPFWKIRESVRREGSWRFAGGPEDIYLVYGRAYDLFGFGPDFLAAARRLAKRTPGVVEIRSHTDRQGGEAFFSVRVGARHEVAYSRGFRIRLGPPDAGLDSSG